MSVARNIGGEDLGGTTSIRKVGIAAFFGAMIEWYDYFLYGLAAAVVFNQLFFPSQAPLAGTLAAFATFGVGFFFRPVGGMIFGHFGDRLGRKTILVLTLLIMGVATFAIGLLCPRTGRSGSWRPSSWSSCARCRASASAGSGAAPP